ncbi:MAG: superoxide dismutase [Pseudarcicella sp.]|nr:superoxide dismutase [Pseudarcicella sp.]
MNRKKFLQNTLGVFLSANLLKTIDLQAKSTENEINLLKRIAPFTQEKLGFEKNALEPFFDTLTMEIHFEKHHKAYIDNLNKALLEPKFKGFTLQKIFNQADKMPTVIRNNAGGHWNHTFFWSILNAPNSQNTPEGNLLKMIETKFDSFTKFKEEFTKAALGRFGSGWTWLNIDSKNELFISSTPNQDNPWMNTSKEKGKPILALDVWEHAYYLKYQNKRVDYINAFWNVVNWAKISSDFEVSIKKK